MTRLYVPPEQLAQASAGAVLLLDAANSHRLSRVLRLESGDALAVFDGAGLEWAAEVLHTAVDAVTITLRAPVTPPAEPAIPVTLVCAFPKARRGDWLVEKATELGVARLVPLEAERSVLDPGDGRLERWRRVAIGAAEQSGRATLPELGGGVPDGSLRLLADTRGGPSVRSVLASVLDGDARPPAVAPPAVALYVGPEGGWSDDERAEHASAGAHAVSLGPRTLRVETAAIAGLAATIAAIEELLPATG